MSQYVLGVTIIHHVSMVSVNTLADMLLTKALLV